MIHKRQWWPNIESIYKARINHFVSTANRHIYNRDLAIDAVHDALAKAVKYHNSHPERKIREQIIDFLIIKSCKRINKYSYEIPVGHLVEELCDRNSENRDW